MPYQPGPSLRPLPPPTSPVTARSAGGCRSHDRVTGSAFFPGGLGSHRVSDDFLEFDVGPSQEITLQWATYRDAADEAGISRLWGGIHVPADDFAGRIMGERIGREAFVLATRYFAEPSTTSGKPRPGG